MNLQICATNEKMVDDCNDDDSDNKILHESLYELFNGDKK